MAHSDGIAAPTVSWSRAGAIGAAGAAGAIGAAGVTGSALWWSANDRPAPKKVVAVDDRLTADQAVKYASQGTAMLWFGDFHNAKQILSAVDRRLTKGAKGVQRAKGGKSAKGRSAELNSAEEFYRIRQARAQRSRMLSQILVPVSVSAEAKTVEVPLPRAPQLSAALAFAYGPQLNSFMHSDQSDDAAVHAVISLQELVGVQSAHQWYLSGVDVPSLQAKIHPHYGTFLPTRHEYVDLVAQAPLPGSLAGNTAGNSAGRTFDIGVGTGVLSAVLVRRGVQQVVGTDIYERAVDCANDNFARLGIANAARAELTSLFPKGRADLIVCNPPWLPGSAATTLDAAIYDPGSKMLLQFLAGLPEHLTEGGEGWLVISDLAELLGLRTREMLLDAISRAGLVVVDRLETTPTHKRARDTDDVLHAARSREVTSLWRLRVEG